MTTALAPELRDLRPTSPPPGRRDKSAITILSRPSLSGGVVGHRIGRGFPAHLELSLRPELRGLGRHRAVPEHLVQQWAMRTALLVALVAVGAGWLLVEVARLSAAGVHRLLSRSGGWNALVDWYGGETA
jgi:hypothetical protein